MRYLRRGFAIPVSVLLLLLSCATHRVEPGELGLSDAQLVERFKQLHEPVYQVYELSGDRQAIHGLLAASFAGEALTSEYVEHWTTLANMQREETSIRIKRVDYERVRVLDRAAGSLRVDVDWSVGGIVTHRAHKHPRVNRYRAVYTLVDEGDGLRIVATRMRNLERIRNVMSTMDDDAFLLDELPGGGGGFMDPLDLLELSTPVEEAAP